jgi:hypothetical protein
LSRRIAFVQLGGGCGASAAAAYVTNLLARRRTGAVLGINASGGSRSMLWHAGLGDVTATRPQERRSHPLSLDDASAGLTRSASGFYALDAREPGSDVAASEAQWAEHVAPISRFYDVICTDWGVRPWQVDLGSIAAGSHAICLVARADRSAAEEIAAVSGAIAALENQPRVVLALVDVGNSGAAARHKVAHGPSAAVVHVRYDAARQSARPVGSPALSTRSRIAGTRLAAALMLPQPRLIVAEGAGR